MPEQKTVHMTKGPKFLPLYKAYGLETGRTSSLEEDPQQAVNYLTTHGETGEIVVVRVMVPANDVHDGKVSIEMTAVDAEWGPNLLAASLKELRESLAADLVE